MRIHECSISLAHGFCFNSTTAIAFKYSLLGPRTLFCVFIKQMYFTELNKSKWKASFLLWAANSQPMPGHASWLHLPVKLNYSTLTLFFFFCLTPRPRRGWKVKTVSPYVRFQSVPGVYFQFSRLHSNVFQLLSFNCSVFRHILMAALLEGFPLCFLFFFYLFLNLANLLMFKIDGFWRTSASHECFHRTIVQITRYCLP